jgi:lipopolysaccharide transport system ATP-binding protein
VSNLAIAVEDLGKRYVIRHEAVGARDGLRHKVESVLRNPLKALHRKRENQASHEEFWALRNVSFGIQTGEVVGIIGRNGAGKSTLLKVLSRITEPTTGRIRIRGRVASLLEVGTGFHQELTGRENIYLNGSILGMPRQEIRRKFDEIVEFAEIEKFLDTPVKRYSSGMYVRLAFSVAAHLEPDILIIDEVLAVGDSQFQKKCLGKMEDVAGSGGRTVLFVSHNMGIITRLCRNSVLLERGQVAAHGPTADVITRYLTSGADMSGIRIWSATESKWRDGPVHPCEVHIIRKVPMFRVALRFLTSDGTLAFTAADSSSDDFAAKPTVPGAYVCRCTVPANLLNEGQYFVSVSGDIPFQQVLFHEESAIGFMVDQTGGVSSRFPEKWAGAVCPRVEWSTLPAHPTNELVTRAAI